MSVLHRFSHRKNAVRCGRTRVTVVKTIRLHLAGVLPWLHTRPRLRLVHLVRNPGAQVQSRLRLRGSFKCESGNVAAYCRAVQEDLAAGAELPGAVYRLVRYEDLVAAPMQVMEQLFSWAGVPLTQTMRARQDQVPQGCDE